MLLGLDRNVPGFIFVFLGLLASVFVVQLAHAALVVGADDALHDRPVSVGSCFGRALKRAPAILGWSMINPVRGVFAVMMYRYLKDGSTLGGFSAPQLEAAVMADGKR